MPELTVLRMGRKARFQPANSFPLTWIPFCFRILTQSSPARDEENVQETVQDVSKGDNTTWRTWTYRPPNYSPTQSRRWHL